MSEKISKKKSRLYLILYSIALFSSAAIIILLSHLYSSRMEDELEESRSISVSAMQSVENLIGENQSLTERLAELENSAAGLEDELAEIREQFRIQRQIADEVLRELDDTRSQLTDMTRRYNELLQQQQEEDNDD
jgi:organic radical activating enzyme